MSHSIISNTRQCLVCRNLHNLHRHHFFGGYANRKISEKYGAWGYFCATHHNMSNYSVHHDSDLRLRWQKIAQTELQKQREWSVEDFRKAFGKSYI